MNPVHTPSNRIRRTAAVLLPAAAAVAAAVAAGVPAHAAPGSAPVPAAAAAPGAAPAADTPVGNDPTKVLYAKIPLATAPGCQSASLGVAGFSAPWYSRLPFTNGYIEAAGCQPGTTLQIAAEMYDQNNAFMQVVQQKDYTVTADLPFPTGPQYMTINYGSVPTGGSIQFQANVCSAGACSGWYRIRQTDQGAIFTGLPVA